MPGKWWPTMPPTAATDGCCCTTSKVTVKNLNQKQMAHGVALFGRQGFEDIADQCKQLGFVAACFPPLCVHSLTDGWWLCVPSSYSLSIMMNHVVRGHKFYVPQTGYQCRVCHHHEIFAGLQ